MPAVAMKKTDVGFGLWRAGSAFDAALWRDETRSFAPVEQFEPTTRVRDSEDTLPTAALLARSFEPPVGRLPLSGAVTTNSVPIQIWEGTVVEVDTGQGIMHVLLDAKMGDIPRHSGEIDLEWVSDQDKDLVVPGAVFYLTLFKRTLPSVENTQELRFRRRPSWSSEQLRQIEQDAAVLSSKMKSLPAAT